MHLHPYIIPDVVVVVTTIVVIVNSKFHEVTTKCRISNEKYKLCSSSSTPKFNKDIQMSHSIHVNIMSHLQT